MDLSIKTFITTAALLSFGLTAHASDVVYAPGDCPQDGVTVWVSNKTNRMQRVWTQTRETEALTETHFDLKPLSKIKITGSQFLEAPSKGYSLKSWENGTLQIETQCFDEEKITLSGTTSPSVDHLLSAQTVAVKISLLNLHLDSQSVELNFVDNKGQLLSTKKVFLDKYYETVALKLSVPAGAAKLQIQGTDRLHSQAQLVEKSGVLRQSPAFVSKPQRLEAPADKTYFLVSTKDNKPEESFVISLDDSQKIATAREQIRNPSLEKIVVAGIEKGNGGFNRAFQSKDKSPYSWSVFRVDSFADFAYIDCDGSPDLTEERLTEKLTAGGGRICFWRYRVVRELSLDEVRSGVLKSTMP